MIHLTPFAWTSGQTSSMLGGAQFKATLLTVKHLPAIYNAKWLIILVTKQEDGKQLSVAWKLTALRGCPSCKFMYQGGQRATHTVQEVSHRKQAPELLLMLPKLVLANILKCKSMLYTYTVQRHCHSTELPHCKAECSLSPFAELEKFNFLKRGEETVSERTSQK